MLEFGVPNMSCGHCVATVTKAAKAVDPAAEVEVDLASRRVRIQSDHAGATFAKALEDAGYRPTAGEAV